MTNLRRLERVELRADWNKEDRHFTPWLAQVENINLLGKTLDVSLEVEQKSLQAWMVPALQQMHKTFSRCVRKFTSEVAL